MGEDKEYSGSEDEIKTQLIKDATNNDLAPESIESIDKLDQAESRRQLIRHVTDHHEREAWLREKQTPLAPIALAGCGGLFMLACMVEPSWVIITPVLFGAGCFTVYIHRQELLNQATLRIKMLTKLRQTPVVEVE
jgi:hypothetical protein